MKIDTIAVHGGNTPELPTKAVVVPVYQTRPYALDSMHPTCSALKYGPTFILAS
jgi:O-acetylhomoserine/O-acetylserine sulfhydrylase-like pyridoxal-dependent enzyme